MWSHYADNHRGIVIEFDFSSDPCSKLYKVQYSKHRIKTLPTIDPKKSILNATIFRDIAITKADEWSYEKEYRGIYDLSETKKIIVNNQAIYLKSIDPKCIKRIYFGVSCPELLINEIKKELSRPELKHVVTENVYLDHYDYKLRFESEFQTKADKLFISMK